MAKVKNFKTIFPAVSVPLNDDYSINEQEFRTYLRWIKSFYDKGIQGLVCNGHTGEITGLTRAERKRVVEICAEECGDVIICTLPVYGCFVLYILFCIHYFVYSILM